ncbi:uncharacterized protein [Littorina saxatilis]|uniref:uncharacterized protein n=1 Tax=Littorina saxatilis TaxID=31220 RepID=UPI0038B43AA3
MEGTYYRCSDDKINWFNASVKRDEESLSTSVTFSIKHKADTIGFSCQPTAKPAHVTIQEHPCFLPHTGHYAKGDSAIRGCSTALFIIIFLCIAVLICVFLRGPNQTGEEGQGEQQPLCIRQRFRNFFKIKTLIAVLTVLFVILPIISLVTMVLSYTVLG